MNDKRAILIVEDDDRWQEILKEPLVDEGYQVTIIADYQDSRQVLEEHTFDLVILDLLLDESDPILGGERLLAHISRHCPGTACVVVSGRGDIRVVRDAFKQHHVVDFIEKERFDILTFIGAVKAALAQAKAGAVGQGSSMPTIAPAVLRQALDERFNLREAKDLCFDLGIDFDNLPGEGKKTREVVSFCQRRDRLEELASAIAVLRPGCFETPVTWPPNLGLASSGGTDLH